MAFTAKLRIDEKVLRIEHRSGWKYALAALDQLLTPDGILVDTFIESNFGWNYEASLNSRIIPYKEPWLGVLHNPVGIPEWHEHYSAPQMMFQLPAWQESIHTCRGIITFSEHMHNWLIDHLDVDILTLRHPTEIPDIKFTFENFLMNPEPMIIQVGWWLRRLHSIYQLPVLNLQKAVLHPLLDDKISLFYQVLNREADCLNLRHVDRTGTKHIAYKNDPQYDELLARNIVFLHLYDSIVNNVIIECIARNTPVLVNRLPSVVEYLGEKYPFYFDTLEEAARKAEDTDLIKGSYEYLQALPKESLSPEFFCQSLAESELYMKL